MTLASTVQLLLLSAVWGMSFLLIRIAGESFPPLWIVLMRSTLGAQSAAMPPSVTRAQYLRGVLLITMGTVGYAIATVIAKSRPKGVDPFVIAACRLGLAGVMVAPLALATGWPAHITPIRGLAMSVLGFAGSGVAYPRYFNLLAMISATQVVAVTYLLPIWGIFWGILAHERGGSATYLGVIVAIAGLVLMNLRGSTRKDGAVVASATGSSLSRDGKV